MIIYIQGSVLTEQKEKLDFEREVYNRMLREKGSREDLDFQKTIVDRTAGVYQFLWEENNKARTAAGLDAREG